MYSRKEKKMITVPESEYLSDSPQNLNYCCPHLWSLCPSQSHFLKSGLSSVCLVTSLCGPVINATRLKRVKIMIGNLQMQGQKLCFQCFHFSDLKIQSSLKLKKKKKLTNKAWGKWPWEHCCLSWTIYHLISEAIC